MPLYLKQISSWKSWANIHGLNHKRSYSKAFWLADNAMHACMLSDNTTRGLNDLNEMFLEVLIQM